jgi:beta-glucosidase
MKTNLRIALILILTLALILTGCRQSVPAELLTPKAPPPTNPAVQNFPYQDPNLPVDKRVDDLLARMTLDEKIGQMTQPEHNSISPADVATYFIGSVLSGGGGISNTNTLAEWTAFVKSYQGQALSTRLGIPLIYGVDSVHGFAHVNGATIFPHNIGLGATRDPELVRQIGQVTAEEMLAAGIPWNFAPTVTVPQDIRWGRTYEGFSEDTDLVSKLGAAYIDGFQSIPDGFAAAPDQTLLAGATAKHYLGDGGTGFGTSQQAIFKPYLLDQGDMTLDEAAIRTLFLPPYQAAVKENVMSVMISFSSWNGTKMHANRYLITDVLKDELGFQGFVVSDWGGIDQVDPDYYQAVITSINAGIDMNMVPYDYKRFIDVMKQAVSNGDIPQERIDDAVRRILRAKFELGLFENPYGDPSLADAVGSDAHRQLARQAVRESLVLLKNDNKALPIDKNAATIFVAGRGADSVGMQCGGWTISWQGDEDLSIKGSTSILSALQASVSPETNVQYDRAGHFNGQADVGIVVVGEAPYAEGEGDQESLELSDEDIQAINTVRPQVDKLVVVLLSGRPMVITDQFQVADAWVAAWLPGSEGAGVTDVLFGDYPFTGRLSYTWPRSDDQLPINKNIVGTKTGCQGPLFPMGYGLGDAGSQPIEWFDCP